ncbi:LysR family transcriptional regulator [Pseudonocardia spinosispora]|uniref:LysR family transcriptional regulator n=1 Tax=Pseudonocardia spinosispora TaxID=103441 RepID=UPI00041CEFC8|nr:LysR family transcriptional regulator [Pseudonocardia spinosispora]
MNVELRHLRAFLAIAEEGAITRAAVRLHVGQPALSRTLRQLEDHLGVRLVDRSTHHLELTSAGHRFRNRAEGALAAVDAALDTTSWGAWPVRLGHAWSAIGDHTAVLLRRWRLAHPTVPLELIQIDTRTAGLAEGRVDLALLRGRTAPPGARTEWLLDETRVAAVPGDSPLADRESVTLADLSGQTVALNPNSGTTTLQLWPTDIRPSSTVTVADTAEWLVAIASGSAVGVSSSATARVHPFPGVSYVPLSDVPVLSVVLAWTDPPTHPSVPDLVALAHEVVGPAG